MKKHFSLLFFCFVSLCSTVKADLFETQEDRSFTVFYSTALPVATSSTTFLLIHLSSGNGTTGYLTEWPHKETGELTLSHIRVNLDKIAASTCTVKFGVVTAINASSGSVTWFGQQNALLNVSNTTGDQRDSFTTPTITRLRVNVSSVNAEGFTPYFLSNDKISLSSADSVNFQSDVQLPSAATDALTFPGVGDLLMFVSKTNLAALNISVEIKYYTRRR